RNRTDELDLFCQPQVGCLILSRPLLWSESGDEKLGIRYARKNCRHGIDKMAQPLLFDEPPDEKNCAHGTGYARVWPKHVDEVDSHGCNDDSAPDSAEADRLRCHRPTYHRQGGHTFQDVALDLAHQS